MGGILAVASGCDLSMSVAVVTGANRIPGIGYEIARGLAHRLPEGSSVVLTARVPEMGTEAIETLKEEVGKRVEVLFHQLDIGDAASVEELRKFISSKFGAIDVLVNNAGLAFPLSDPTPFKDQARQSIDVNYYGTKRMLTILRPLLKPHSRAVGISSTMGQLSSWSQSLQEQLLSDSLTLEGLDTIAEDFVKAAQLGQHREKGFPGSAYGTSKALMTQLHRVLAKEGPPPGLLCSVCPGLCRTYMATGRGTFMSNVLWLASFVVGSSAEGGADTPLWLCTELPEADFPTHHGRFLRGRTVSSY